MANIAETERKAVGMADGILAAVNENGNIDRFIDTKGGVHYIEPKRYEESVAKIDAAATKAKETVNSATEAVSECKAQTGACTQETARAKEIADTVESRITGIEGDVAALRDSVSHIEVGDKNRLTFTPQTDCDVFVLCAVSGIWGYGGGTVTMRVNCSQLETVSAHVGKFSGGNTEFHQIVFWSVFRGAKAGVTYSFSMSESGAPQGDKERTALCMAVHL